MLEDNAKIQLSEAAHRNKKSVGCEPEKLSRSSLWGGNYDRSRKKIKLKRRENPLKEPLYTLEHVQQTYPLIKNGGFEYKEWIRLAKGVELKFYSPGHVLGGAICVFKIAKRNGFLYLGFSGDLGRDDGVILPPPQVVEEPLDHWFTESTYGGRIHPPRAEEIALLQQLVKEAVEEKRTIIIPSFALERTQEIIYLVSQAIDKGLIPKIPIYLDSPMSAKITQAFSGYWRSPGLFKGQEELSFNPFCPEENKLLHLIINSADSVALMSAPFPKIVVSSSGMCEAGRVRGHLRAWLRRENATVCLVGYMVEGSLGWKLKQKWPIVRMNNEEIVVKAKIVAFEGFSAHADSPFLVAYAGLIADKNSPNFKSVFELHGEKKGALDLKVELMEKLGISGDRIIIPREGDVYYL